MTLHYSIKIVKRWWRLMINVPLIWWGSKMYISFVCCHYRTLKTKSLIVLKLCTKNSWQFVHARSRSVNLSFHHINMLAINIIGHTFTITFTKLWNICVQYVDAPLVLVTKFNYTYSMEKKYINIGTEKIVLEINFKVIIHNRANVCRIVKHRHIR